MPNFLFPVSRRSALVAVGLLAAITLPGVLPAHAQQNPPAASAAPALPGDVNALFTPTYQLQNTQPPFLLRTVFRRLAAQASGTRTFTETRTFSISRRPVVTHGTLRYNRRAGLSMAYESVPGQPPARVLIIDDRGLIERNADGRERSVSVADRPELAALTDVYLNLLRGDATKLFNASNAYFAGDKRGWQLGLVPKDEGIARRVGRAVVSGRAPNIRQIDTISSGGDVRRLELGPIRVNTGFSPEDQKAFFRGSEG